MIAALVLWWFAIINAHGEILIMSNHRTEAGCNAVRDTYASLHLKTMKITKCVEKT